MSKILYKKSRYFVASLISVIAFNIYASSYFDDEYAQSYNNADSTQEYNDSSSTDQISMTLSPSILFSDTRGPSFTLLQGSATSRSIIYIDATSGAGGYYSSPNCQTGTKIGSISAAIQTGTFNFSNNVAIYFGQTSLAALAQNNVSVRCINAILRNTIPPATNEASIRLQIRNLICSSSTCTGGNVCYSSVSRWTTTTPLCA